ncbi:MAG: porin family protein [Candidatus Eisenbacteria bacterium]|nr:porin family protein [Candidatus Eisenbacteria bacterium]
MRAGLSGLSTRCIAHSALVGLLLVPGFAVADPGTAEGRHYSHRGMKAAMAIGSLHNTSKLNLSDAGMFGLRVGYGFDDRLSLWLGASGSDHDPDRGLGANSEAQNLGGLNLAVQYRFLPEERVQPYGTIGIGAYSMEEESTHDALSGGGFTFGLGADWFVSRRVAFGAELEYRNASYTHERVGEKGKFKEREQALDGDAMGLLFSISLQ